MSDRRETFINPYNFVPLDGKAPSRSKLREEITGERYTGKIQYRIETLSPLFIPNTSNDRILGVKGESDSGDAYHKSYDFFSYHDLSRETDPDAYYEPVIPGSELRGMVRSVYETMTNSCLSAVDEDALLSKRTAEHFEAGVLMKSGDGYQLYAAKDYLYRANGRADFALHSYEDKSLPEDGSHVYFSEDKKSSSDRPVYAKPFVCDVSSARDRRQQKEGYLIKGEPGPELAKSRGSKCDACPAATKRKCKENGEKNCYLLEKHCAHVFEKGRPVRNMAKTEAADVSRRMDKLLVIYASNRDRKDMYREYRKTWSAFKRDDKIKGIAVYYSIADNVCYLSPACITREVYHNTLQDILGAHCACKEAGNACPACRLFGTVNGRLQIASRLRFSDAYVEKKRGKDADYYDAPLTLLELSNPKLSSTEIYLRRPEDKRILNWTYDYYVTLGADNSTSVKAYMPRISGRKFYWHSPQTVDWMRSIQDKIPKNERNRTVRPVSRGVAFLGELYFDGITKEELDDLIQILNLSSLGEDGKYAMKLGSGKPLGLGSVAMRIEWVVYRTISLSEETGLIYKADNPYDYQAVDFTQKTRGTGILTILDTQALGKLADGRVHYPYVEKREPGEEEGFVWFTQNRAGKRKDNRTKLLDMKKTVDAPKSRDQILYQEYMKPLEPQFVLNPTSDTASDKTSNKTANSHSRTAVHYEKGKQYRGIVKDYKKDRFAQVELETGGWASFPVYSGKNRGGGEDVRKVLPVGTKVSVTYQGKDDRGFDRWQRNKPG